MHVTIVCVLWRKRRIWIASLEQYNDRTYLEMNQKDDEQFHCCGQVFYFLPRFTQLRNIASNKQVNTSSIKVTLSKAYKEKQQHRVGISGDEQAPSSWSKDQFLLERY